MFGELAGLYFWKFYFKILFKKLVSLLNLLGAQRHIQEQGGFIYVEYKL